MPELVSSRSLKSKKSPCLSLQSRKGIHGGYFSVFIDFTCLAELNQLIVNTYIKN